MSYTKILNCSKIRKKQNKIETIYRKLSFVNLKNIFPAELAIISAPKKTSCSCCSCCEDRLLQTIIHKPKRLLLS